MKKIPENAHLGYSDTPTLPDSGYHVHDGERPQPPVVTPGATAADAPSDSTLLLDGSSLKGWVSADNPAQAAAWRVVDGVVEVVPGTGDIQTTVALPNRFQLHLEFASPAEVLKEGQGRGNSGIFLMTLYEIQVLDNFHNPTYPDGTVGGIYGQWPPLANAIREPGAFNTVDILWEGPRFEGNTLARPAFVTVLLNGVCLHHHKELHGPTEHRKLTEYKLHPDQMPLKLQDHGDLVRFRNIWYRQLGEYDA